VNARAPRSHSGTRVEVARFLDPHIVASVEQKLEDEIERLLRARCDDHLID
jgi:hypothetical protein